MGKKYDLTSPQKSIWYTEEVFKGTTVNNICTTGIIYEKINEDLLKQAINNIVKQNDSFRIHLTLENGIIKQYISDFEKFDINVEFIDNASKLKEIEESESNYLFSLIDSNLFKFKIVILKNKFTAVILTANHIISDSWSMGITIQEILRNYHSLLSKEIPTIDTFSYLDYIDSEEKYLNSKKYESDKIYWEKEFETIPEQATIPSVNQNSSSLSNIAKRFSFELDKKFVNKIDVFCKKNHFSFFAFFMSVYSVYISRVSNTDDFVIGTPILNRTNMKEKHTTGMFVNTAPVRINIFNSGAFCDFVNTISQKIMGVLRHQKYSYNRIIEDLRKDNKNLANLYNIIISYQITKAFNKDFGNYKTNWTFNNYIANDMNIHITDINDTGNLTINYDYLVDKYSEKDIEDLHMRIIYIIEQILSNSNILLDDIEIVTKQERDVILNTFNNTTKDYPKNKTIVDLFEEQVDKTPDNIAVVFEDEKLTYKELNEKANSLANFLISKGLEKDSTVSIFIDKSIESIIAILSILKCGCSYMPIDIDYPLDRISYMLENSNSRFILTTNNLKVRLETLKNYVFVDLSDKKTFDFSSDNVVIPLISDSIAYIMYTSGSTGKPKGVMVTNRNVVRLVKNTNYISFKKHERILQTGSIVFDACTFEIWGALLNGFELYIIKKEDLLDPSSLQNYLVKNKITILWVTAPLFNQLSENNPEMFSSCRVLLTGGDVLSPKHISLVRKACPNLTIINGYGPTENTTFSTCFTIDKNYSSSIPIGYPIANSTCYVVSKNLKLLPIGVPGELLVGGDGVSKGYLKNPHVTSEKFIPNIFGEGKLYKTGDLVRWNKNGSIDFIGRIDNQVKIRGFRVEINEITLTIQKYKNINECVVVVREINGEKVLCSYFSSDVEINIKALKSFLEKLLPYYAIPTYFMQLDSLPINTNGKIDRNKLPIPKRQNKHIDIVSPRNELDEKLIALLKEILNIDVISIEDNFFELGGDSLSAINYCSLIQKDFNIKLFVRDILENPTIKDLSDLISNKHQKFENLRIKTIPKADSYPVSSAQKRIYFASKLAGNDSILYNISGGIILSTDTIDLEKLKNCFYTLIKRHESLRTYFELKNETVVQKIVDNTDFNIDIIEDYDYEKVNLLFKNLVKPFDLSKAPLFRSSFIKFTNGKSAIFIDMHHIISDGTSLAIFTDELCKLYNGENLSNLNITYKDYSVYENEVLSDEKMKIAEDYWIKQFQGELPVLNMPTNYTRPAVQSFKGHKIYSSIDENIYKKIKHLCISLNVTPYMFLLSCYYILLSKYTSQDDIIIGSPIVGRDIPETYNLIGMFVNTLALRNKVDSSITFKTFVNNIKNSLLEAYKYQSYPFDELVSELNIRRDTSRNPLFDTIFTYQNNSYKDLNLNNINTEYYIPDMDTSKFDFSLEVIPNKKNISLIFEYSTSLFDESFIKVFSDHYLNIIKGVISNIDIKISDIDMLSKNEKDLILYHFNDTSRDYPKDKTIVDIFENIVNMYPDNTAVVFENKKMTYRELNEHSNRFANYLKNIGISKGMCVPVIMDRSINLVISMLALIKIGAIYLPITPETPMQRIKYIIDDSESSFFITNRDNLIVKNTQVININNIDYSKYLSNNLNIALDPSDLLYIIYTSGSTGNPKGVKVGHNNLVNFIYSFINSYKTISTNDRLLSSTNISFDVSIFELFMPLLNGFTLYLYNESHIVDINKFCDSIIHNNITFAYIPPNILDIVYDILSTYENISLNKLLLGVEPIKSDTVQKYFSLNSDFRIINAYGPTETTICATSILVDQNIIDNYSIIPIGKPLDNLKLYILDKDMQPVPIGITGELYISGDNVSQGYLNNSLLTDKSFISIPTVNCRYAYKTGDLAKWDNNGIISFIGRNDNQIKINGYRIELKEIENIMLKYPNIQKVSVIAQKLNNRAFLSAYFIGNTTVTANDLKTYLSKYLPWYMVPSYYISLDEFPYTSNGKIDKKSLPLPSEILSTSNKNYVAPETEMQHVLVDIWENLLNTKPIGIYDNFFELGGDSLLVMRLNVELLKLSQSITYQDIFTFPTIAELEKRILFDDESLAIKKIENLSDSFVDILRDTKKKKPFKKYHPNSILLTGSTGFLGIHILKEFLANEHGSIYCIVRDSKDATSMAKLHEKLNYYFGNKYDSLLNNRIFAITGDITKPGFGLNQDDLLKLADSVDLVINSAANVSHFGHYNSFYNTNVTGVKHIVDFCKSFNKKLYHISTISVAGTKLNNIFPSHGFKNKHIFDESSLYIGQVLDNIYAHSKFEAETIVLTAISEGLDGYILRMGNLMPRIKDGVFQENIRNNDFVSKISSFIKIKMVPDYLLDYQLNFTPIDQAAKSIYKLVSHPNKTNRVFHLYNKNNISVRRFTKILNKLKYNIKILSDEDFKKEIRLILDDIDNKDLLKNLSDDFDKNLHLNYNSDIEIKSDFTNKYLFKTKFLWAKISNRYLKRFIRLLRKEF